MAKLKYRAPVRASKDFPEGIFSLWVPNSTANDGWAPVCADLPEGISMLIFPSQDDAMNAARQKGLGGVAKIRNYRYDALELLAQVALKNGIGLAHCKGTRVTPLGILRRLEAEDGR